jgi:hypothetical protein
MARGAPGSCQRHGQCSQAIRCGRLGGVSRLVIEAASHLTPEQKLAMSLEMFSYGCAAMRENLRRQNPQADDATIEGLLHAWLRTRPGAEFGDGVGRPASWPRRGGRDA